MRYVSNYLNYETEKALSSRWFVEAVEEFGTEVDIHF